MNITEPKIDVYSYIIYSEVVTNLNSRVATNGLGFTQEYNSAETMYYAADCSNKGKNLSDPVLLTLISACISALPDGGTICLKNLTYDDSLSLPVNVSIVTFINGSETHYPASSETGSTGAAGADGATWTTGSGVPTAAAAEGDLYLDTATGDLYKMISTTWTADGNIKGTNGTDGNIDSVFLNGSGVPGSGLGDDGDYYIDTATGDVYFKNTTWSIVINIAGADGSNGSNGSNGTNGTNGDTLLILDAAETSFAGDTTKYVDAGLVSLEAGTQIPIAIACDVISIAANVITNTLDVGTTVQLRKNGVNIGTPITIATLASGAMSEAQTVASFAANDLLSVSVVPASTAGSGALTIGKIVITIFS